MLPDFESVSFYAHPDDNELVAAYCEHEKQWWGELRVFHHTDDEIDWKVSFPKQHDEEHGHYVVSCQWLKLSISDKPLLAVIESTHRGNGSLWLFELQDTTFKVLLKTSVRGQYWGPPEIFGIPLNGEAHFDKDKLLVSYPVLEGQKNEAVVITSSL
ncbi:MAG: hypothetical protein KDK97_19940, partial [Verrucomicrobiales bacterium]|nr:hypothetical protein [Verrucomicrobiales bacterium]